MNRAEMAHKQQLIEIFTERLQYLEAQSAILGPTNVPFVIAKEISDIKENIRKLKWELGDLESCKQTNEEVENDGLETGYLESLKLENLAQLKQEQAKLKFDMRITGESELRASLKREIRKLQDQIDDIDYTLYRQGIRPAGMPDATREWVLTSVTIVLILGAGIFVGIFEGVGIAIVCYILWLIFKETAGGIGGGSTGSGIGS